MPPGVKGPVTSLPLEFGWTFEMPSLKVFCCAIDGAAAQAARTPAMASCLCFMK